MEFLVKVVTSILGLIGGVYVNIGGSDISLVNYGDGLYEQEKGFYVYKGSNPNNYISFNNELWRIIYINKDLIKIVKNSSIGDMAFDENDNNDWDESSLKKSLYNYYSDINNKYQKIVLGNIEILSMNDYLQANSNFKLCGSLDLYFKNDRRCSKNNYIDNLTKGNKNHAVWTLTKDEDTVLYIGNTYFSDIRPSDSSFGVLPILYLNKNIGLYGKGTLQNPYKIKF